MREVERNKSVVIIIIIFFLAIGFVFFKYKLNNKYVKVNRSFANALVIDDKVSTDKTINIEMAGKMIQGDGVKSCKNSTELRGTILIDNKKYLMKLNRRGEVNGSYDIINFVDGAYNGIYILGNTPILY